MPVKRFDSLSILSLVCTFETWVNDHVEKLWNTSKRIQQKLVDLTYGDKSKPHACDISYIALPNFQGAPQCHMLF